MRRGFNALVFSGLLALAMPAFAANTPVTMARHIVLDNCVVGGCSNELCTDASATPAASSCIAQPASQCYATLGECKRQPSGNCGWTPSGALAACVAHPPALPGSVVPNTVGSSAPQMPLTKPQTKLPTGVHGL